MSKTIDNFEDFGAAYACKTVLYVYIYAFAWVHHTWNCTPHLNPYLIFTNHDGAVPCSSVRPPS